MLKRRKLPFAIHRILTSPNILKFGLGVQRGLDRLYEKHVLTRRARGVVDLYPYLREEEEWRKAVYTLVRKDSYERCHDDPKVIRHGRQLSGDVRFLKGEEKLIYLSTYELMSVLEEEKAAFNKAFFHRDFQPYINGIENYQQCMFHCAAYAQKALYCTYLAFFKKIVSAAPVSTKKQFVSKAMSFFGVKEDHHFLKEKLSEEADRTADN